MLCSISANMKRRYQLYFCIYTVLNICFQTNSASYSKFRNLSTVKEILGKLLNQISSNKTLMESDDIKRLMKNYNTLESISLQTHNVMESVINRTHIHIPRFRDFLNTNVSRTSFRRTMGKTVYDNMKKRMSKDDITRLLKMKWKYKMGYRRMNSAENEETLKELSDQYMNSLVTNLSDVDVILPRKKRDYWVFRPEFKTKLEMLNTRRIFNGHKVLVENFPFMASVLLMGKFWCGGSIIDSDLIATSAACLQLWWNNRFYRENPKSLSVRVGSDYALVSGEIHDVLEIYFHPSYKPKTLENNIAIMRLEFHIKFNKHMKRIKLYKQVNPVPINTNVYILGWGAKTNSDLLVSPINLQYGLLPVYPLTMCKEAYGSKIKIDRNMFCAGDLFGTVTTCNHDAGGPAVLDSRLVGIISFVSAACARSETPTVFVQVSYYVKWIKSIMNQSRPPSRYMSTTDATTTTTITTALNDLEYGSNLQDDGPIIHDDDPILHEDDPILHEDDPILHEDDPILPDDGPNLDYENYGLRSKIKDADGEEGSVDESNIDYVNETNVDMNDYYANEIEESSLVPNMAKTGDFDPGSQSMHDVYNAINEEQSEKNDKQDDQDVNNRDLHYVTSYPDPVPYEAGKTGTDNTVKSIPPTVKATIDLPAKPRRPMKITNRRSPATTAFNLLRTYDKRPIKITVSPVPTMTLTNLMNLPVRERRPKKKTTPLKGFITSTSYSRRPNIGKPRVSILKKKKRRRGRKKTLAVKHDNIGQQSEVTVSFVNASLDNVASYFKGLIKSARIMHHSGSKEMPIFKIHSEGEEAPDYYDGYAARKSKTTVPFAVASLDKIASYFTGLTKGSHVLHYSRPTYFDRPVAKNDKPADYYDENLKQIARTNNNYDENDNEYGHRVKVDKNDKFSESEDNTHDHMKIFNKDKAARHMEQIRNIFQRKGPRFAAV